MRAIILGLALLALYAPRSAFAYSPEPTGPQRPSWTFLPPPRTDLTITFGPLKFGLSEQKYMETYIHVGWDYIRVEERIEIVAALWTVFSVGLVLAPWQLYRYGKLREAAKLEDSPQ